MNRKPTGVDEVVEEARRVLPPFSTDNDLVGLQIFPSVKCAAKARFRGEGPPFIKRGRRVLYARADVVRWLLALRVERSSGDAA